MIKLNEKPQILHKIILLLIMIILFTGGDLLVKELAASTLKGHPDKTVIKGFWSFHYTENRDIGFSVLRFLDKLLNSTQKFILLVSLQYLGSLLATLFYFYFNRWKYSLPLALIICGGLGNATDRLLRGYVVDYVKWYIKDFIWPIFNLADVYTVIGAFSLLIIFFFFSKELKEAKSS